MPWVFFHRHMTNYFPVLDRSIRLPIYDLLAPTCAKHTGTQQKELDSLLNEKEIQLQGKISTRTRYYVYIFKRAQEKAQRVENTEKWFLS